MAALTLTALLDHAAKQHGENLALIALRGLHLTHRKLHGAIEKVVAQLRRFFFLLLLVERLSGRWTNSRIANIRLLQ
jgi:acyl-CoA synthetase (AMP-forming)/AMP-acid ligase II